jgi:hypothetical protein
LLHAVLGSKAGKLPVSDGTVSWRSAFRISEDLLTASVFGRLSYLDGPALWRVLRTTFGHSLPEYRVAELKEIAFWPK